MPTERHNSTIWNCAAHNTRCMAPPKVLLFGSSGGTGRYVAKFALEADHNVIAFVVGCTPDK